MIHYLPLGKYSFGMGDRFARQARAQLQACVRAAAQGVDVVPVWNKSNREHVTIGSEPAQCRQAADAAVKALRWNKPFFVDADHIRVDAVDRFIPHSDFFTLDVADWIGQPAPVETVRRFLDRHTELYQDSATADRPAVEKIANKYLAAVLQAGETYRHIANAKGAGNFVTEVSMDETDSPQTPTELRVILAALSDQTIPLQTIAPKFSGRFNKGVDYVGDVAQFEKELNEDLAVIAFAVKEYGFPPTLKLSIHSGSDKFSIYGALRRAVLRHGVGLHLKTAGTTWLEEVTGLAAANGDGLALAKDIYVQALEHIDELCAPYAAVLDIDRSRLPVAKTVQKWDSGHFVSVLRHDPKNPAYNPSVRQLLHVGYKIAAHMGDRYLKALDQYESSVSANVTENLYERHIKPLFLAKD
jgi:tagaturonate epimerase